MYSMRICKRCDHPMDVKKDPVTRRGHKQENMPAEYYCSKCDHSEYDTS